jgi:hypothetical protein
VTSREPYRQPKLINLNPGNVRDGEASCFNGGSDTSACGTGGAYASNCYGGNTATDGCSYGGAVGGPGLCTSGAFYGAGSCSLGAGVGDACAPGQVQYLNCGLGYSN